MIVVHSTQFSCHHIRRMLQFFFQRNSMGYYILLVIFTCWLASQPATADWHEWKWDICAQLISDASNNQLFSNKYSLDSFPLVFVGQLGNSWCERYSTVRTVDETELNRLHVSHSLCFIWCLSLHRDKDSIQLVWCIDSDTFVLCRLSDRYSAD